MRRFNLKGDISVTIYEEKVRPRGRGLWSGSINAPGFPHPIRAYGKNRRQVFGALRIHYARAVNPRFAAVDRKLRLTPWQRSVNNMMIQADYARAEMATLSAQMKGEWIHDSVFIEVKK